MASKRLSLLKYNVQFRLKRGQFYDPAHDAHSNENNYKVLNVLDLANQKEHYLLDEYSDAALYGGLSETLL